MNFTISWIASRRRDRCAFQCLNIGSVAFVLLLVVTASSTNAQLLVGNGFPSSTNSVLRVNAAIPQVTGVFGSAVNFDPAPGAMVQDSQGRVYILESNQSRIRRFDSSGNFLGYFANGGFGGGLGLTMGMAIDAFDNIYVVSGGANSFNISDDAIVRFSSNGTPLGTFGQASNAASGYIAGGPLAFDHQGNLYTAYAGQIVRYSPSGTSLGVFANTPSALGLAFNSQGDLFVSGSDVLRFSSTGTPLGTFANNSGSSGLAFDAAGNLFVANDVTDTLSKYNLNGVLLAAIGSPILDGPSNLLFLAPEPTALALLVSAASMIVVNRPRRRSP
jgi:sugar lactone lactonase YvrE